MKEYTREDLLNICEKAFVKEECWMDRDSKDSQCQLGECYALLKDGCDFKIIYGDDNLATDEDTIFLEIFSKGFGYFDWNGSKIGDTFYLPTLKKLEEVNGTDWYCKVGR